MSETVKVTLLTAKNRPVKDGFMVVGDGTVDGQKTDVFFWDPPEADRLQPGATVEVVFDGKNARWQTRDGKTSFHIRKFAEVTFQSGGAPTQPKTTTLDEPQGPQTALSYEEANSQAVTCMEDMYRRMAESSLPEEMWIPATLASTDLRTRCWFGEKHLIT